MLVSVIIIIKSSHIIRNNVIIMLVPTTNINDVIGNAVAIGVSQVGFKVGVESYLFLVASAY